MSTAPFSLDGAALAPALSVRGLVKRYDDVEAVAGIDFEVARGICLGVLGPNGAGKTTTIEILEGLKQPDAGEVEVLGRRWKRSAREIRSAIGVQLQETTFQEKLTTRESLRMFRSFYAEGVDIEEVIRLVGLEEKVDTRIMNLSGGQKQRLAIGCALLNKPEILFLDEPTTGLDPQARRRVWEIVEEFKARGGTVLLTTHYMEEAERLADDLLIVDQGKVIARGSPTRIIASLGAESVVTFVLAGDPPPPLDDATLAQLGSLAGVKSVRVENNAVVLPVTDTQRCIAALFDWLKEHDVELEDLRTHRPTLEDVFVTLTGKHLRDD